MIVAYRPKPGKETERLDLVRGRVPTLRKEGLVTDRKPTIMRGSDGTIIEVSDGNRRTRSMQRTRIRTSFVMWDKFFAICDCVPLNMLPESAEMFAGFEPIGD